MTLSAREVSISFGGVQALQDVSIVLEQGRTVALIGPNGAGKSTLINCLTGHYQPSSGSVVLDGRDITRRPPEARVMDGLARTFQTPRIDHSSTVRENVMVGFYAETKSRLLATMVRSPRQRREEKMIQRAVDELLERFELTEVAHTRAGELPVWQVRIVEIARSATMKPSYMLLDEPAAGLDAAERQRLVEHIKALSAAGIGVLLVEHNFDFVRQVSDHVMVIDRGRSLAEGTVDEITKNALVIEAYLGGVDNGQ